MSLLGTEPHVAFRNGMSKKYLTSGLGSALDHQALFDLGETEKPLGFINSRSVDEAKP